MIGGVTRLLAVLSASLFGLWACEKTAPTGELSRDECVKMVLRLNELRDRELGRANSVEQRSAVDRCLEHGTRRQLECVEFARSAGEVARCDELAK
jgi:hypothetical protein